MTTNLPSLNDGVVCAYGDLMQDHVVALHTALEINGQVDGDIKSRPGGAGANVATAAAKAGAPSRFIGHVGQDDIGRGLLDEVKRQGLDMRPIQRGTSAVIFALQFASNEAALIHAPGDRYSVQPDDIRQEWFSDVAVFHINGFSVYYEQARPPLLQAVAYAKRAGAAISFDTASSNMLLDYGLDHLRRFLETIRPDVILCNEPEGEILGLPDSPLYKDALIVQHRGVASTRVYGRGEPQEFRVEPITEAVDLVGAGDAFAGGFLAGWNLFNSLEKAIETAHWAAADQIRAINC